MASPAVLPDPPVLADGSSGADPSAAEGASSGDLNEVSPSDQYLFTYGQPMSENSKETVVEVSDSQCVAAEASVTAALNEEHVIVNVVDEGGSDPASQSILQNVVSQVSSQSSSNLSSSDYGTRELRTKAKSVVSKLLQKRRPSPVSATARTGNQPLPWAGGHSMLPVVVPDRPLSSRVRAKKT